MRVTIGSSSNDLIDDKYKESAGRLLNYLVTIPSVQLNWGSGSGSIMGLCYKKFAETGHTIFGYTTKKYVNDLVNLSKAKHKILDTTYDLKKEMMYDGDITVILAGGTGTISEFFGHLEENRSNDSNKLLILWNEDHFFDSLLSLIDELVDKKFNNKTIYDYFKVANSIEEFKSILKENGCEVN